MISSEVYWSKQNNLSLSCQEEAGGLSREDASVLVGETVAFPLSDESTLDAEPAMAEATAVGWTASDLQARSPGFIRH